LSALVATGIVYLAETRNKFFDSRVYYGAIEYWFRQGGMVYDWLLTGTPYGFTYPPFAGLAMAPMVYLPISAVIVIATIATVITTAVLVWWFAGPLIKRKGWTTWYAFAIAVCLALAFEPVRETISFGQVNTLLLTLVAGDMIFGVARGRKWSGIGIGLATAVKLTPGVFILYLLLTRRWRAALTASGTAYAATLVAGALFPDQSREFWTSALWDTSRVGVLDIISNQSERGLLARLDLGALETKVWAACVLVTLVIWAWRVLRTRDDIFGGFALTGVLGCLISPVTWVHHCVWLIPALVRCIDVGFSRPHRRQLVLAGTTYLVLSSRLLWVWERQRKPPLEFVGSNLYVWFSLALLFWTPLGKWVEAPAAEPELTPPQAEPVASSLAPDSP